MAYMQSAHRAPALILAAMVPAFAASAAQQASPRPAQLMTRTATQQTAARTTEPESPRKPGSEGIKVHGHWALSVHNADGSFVKKIDFENALVTPASGDFTIAALLGGGLVVGQTEISLSGTACKNNVCLITTSANTIDGAACASGGQYTCATGLVMQYTLPQQGTTPQLGSQVIFTGSLQSANGGTVTFVSTKLNVCESSVLHATYSDYTAGLFSSTATTPASENVANTSPAMCLKGQTAPNEFLADFSFTSTAVPGGGLALAPGQYVTVVVTISFS